MNNINLIGNISTDIDLKATPNGKFVATFNIAVNNPYKRDKVSFIPLEVWGKSGENTAAYCKKGSKVGITGYLEIVQYEKDGQKRSFTKVVAESVQFLDSKRDGQQSNTNTATNNQNANTRQYDPFANAGTLIDISDDDLPF